MTDTIPTRRVGRTALQIARLGLGTAPLGDMYTTLPEPQAQETIRAALAHGINFIDTAPYYGLGKSEERIGAALAGIPRDHYVLETKVGRTLKPDRSAALTWPEGIVFDYSRDAVLRGLEGSRRRLRVERMDIVLIHDPDAHYRDALDKAFPALAELRAQGVIKAIGAGMNQWQMLADFARHADFDCFLLAGRYTLLEQSALEFLALCEVKGISVFLGGVFNSGILARSAHPGAKYNYEEAPSAIWERVRRIEAVCARYGVPLKAAALQFPAVHPAVASLIVGAESPAEIAENLQMQQAPIPSALWGDLKAERLLAEAAPVPGG
jgi:D-threo-aldose 1-dehydrogenase